SFFFPLSLLDALPISLTILVADSSPASYSSRSLTPSIYLPVSSVYLLEAAINVPFSLPVPPLVFKVIPNSPPKRWLPTCNSLLRSEEHTSELQSRFDL